LVNIPHVTISTIIDGREDICKNIYILLGDYFYESFTRIYISSWRSILTNASILTNPLQEYIYILMDEHSSESNNFNLEMDEH
jgi:hypothetical protein